MCDVATVTVKQCDARTALPPSGTNVSRSQVDWPREGKPSKCVHKVERLQSFQFGSQVLLLL